MPTKQCPYETPRAITLRDGRVLRMEEMDEEECRDYNINGKCVHYDECWGKND